MALQAMTEILPHSNDTLKPDRLHGARRLTMKLFGMLSPGAVPQCRSQPFADRVAGTTVAVNCGWRLCIVLEPQAVAQQQAQQ